MYLIDEFHYLLQFLELFSHQIHCVYFYLYMKRFKIPKYYESNLIKEIKNIRKEQDPRKKDFSPSILKFNNINIILPRHFGFCYGVENAVEITYDIINKNPNKKIYLLSEMIHNPQVNENLKKNGIKFIRTTDGKQLIPWNKINSNDIINEQQTE